MGQRDDELDLYRQELDRLRQAAAEFRDAYHERERQLQVTRRKLEQLTRRERALREHPVVRSLQAVAQLSRELRVRLGLASTTTGGGTEPGAGASRGLNRSLQNPTAATTPAGGRDGTRWRPPVDAATEAPDPGVYRERLLAKLRSSEDPPLMALAGHRDGFAGVSTEIGCRLHPVPAGDPAACPADADVVLVTSPDVDVHELPSWPVRVALVDGNVEAWLAQPWFDDVDVVLAPDASAARLIRERSTKVATAVEGHAPAGVLRAALLGWAQATRVSLAVATPDREVAEWWGDTHFGRAVQRELEHHGHPTRLYLRTQYSFPDLVRADVALHLAGLAAPRPQPGQVNVLWVISHPERVTPERCEPYDLVFVASERVAAHMTATVRPPVLPLLQATDPERFTPDPTGPAHDLLFVGNSRRRRRTIIDDLTPTRHNLAVYGRDWTPDLLDPRYLRGEIIANAELHRYYASAKIVLNDHWPEMARLGFISNRIYDALAAGAMVLSDEVEGLAATFDGAVLTYRGRDQLRALVERYLDDGAARRLLAERGRAVVLERHTFAHRVERLLEFVRPFLTTRGTTTGAR